MFFCVLTNDLLYLHFFSKFVGQPWFLVIIDTVEMTFQFAAILSPIHDKTNIFKIEKSTILSLLQDACGGGKGTKFIA
jgi:hypothetical protein